MKTHELFTASDRRRVIDNETGIIRWIAEVPYEPGEPEIFNYSAKMADTGQYLPLRCYDSNGGAGLSREDAYFAAVGEAIERYCCSVYFQEDLILGTYHKVSHLGRALQPEELALFHPEQKDYIHYPLFQKETNICWTWGYSISKKQHILLPACLAYIPYYPFLRERGEETIGPSISTGQASAYTYHEAILRGLYEVVERDAFMITWLNRLSIPRIDIHSSPLISEIFLERFARPHLQYTLYQMASDLGIPCVLCMIINMSGDPHMICMGGAANLNPEKAALKALVEAAQTYQWARFLGKRQKPFVIESDYSNIDDFEKHVFLYAYGNMRPAIDFLLKSKQEISFSNILNASTGNSLQDLRKALSCVESQGYEVMAIDLTTGDVKECGYHVVKVFVPLAQQMEGDHNHRLLGGARLYEVPARLGYSVQSNFRSLNPYPHPYP